MTASMIQVEQYTPERHPLNVFSLEHMKQALGAVVAKDVIIADEAEPTTIAGCNLVGGGLMVLALMAANTVVMHEKRHLTDIAATDVNAVVVLEGSGSASTSDAEMDFRAGDVFFMKAHSPSMVRIDETCRMLILRIPFARFGLDQHSVFSDFVPSLGRHDSPLRLATWNYVHGVLPSLGASALETVANAERAFIALLAAVYAESRQIRDEAGKAAPRWDTVVSMIDTMLDDPRLNVASLSVALGMSTRRVHTLFSHNGHRYSAYLLEKRLSRARDALCNPGYAELDVAAVGYRCGFKNAGQFSLNFEQRYGMSPASYRSAALG